jgi:predicted ATPase
MDLADPAQRTLGGRLLSFDLYAAALSFLTVTLAYLGYIDQARSRMDEAMSEARRIKHAHTLAMALAHAASLDQFTGSPMTHTAELLALSTESGFPYYLSFALRFQGRSMIAHGQAQEGLGLLKQAQAELCAIRCTIGMPMLLMWLAEAHAMLGQPAEERDCLAEAAKLIETTDERAYEAEWHRVSGNLRTAAGDQSRAEQHYRQAIAVAERQSAKLFQLRASISLARLWRDQGRQAEARDLLGPIYGWFTEGFDAPDLTEAKALLEELA